MSDDQHSSKPDSIQIRTNDTGQRNAVADAIFRTSRRLEALSGKSLEPFVRWFVPGRIEVIGKHVDYAGGSSVTCAVRNGFTFSAVKTDGTVIRVHREDDGSEVSIHTVEPVIEKKQGWHLYPETVVRRLVRNLGPLSGATIVFSSSLPPAAGMSSSTAFVCGLLLCLRDLNSLGDRPLFRDSVRDDVDLAIYASVIENGRDFGSLKGELGVGTLGGSQDHLSVLCGQENALTHFGYQPARLITCVTLPPGWVFAVAASGVIAAKTGNAQTRYNDASQLATEAVSLWNRVNGTRFIYPGEIVTRNPDFQVRFSELLTSVPDPALREALSNRMRHFVHEQQCVDRAVSSLQQGDMTKFGRAVFASQVGAEKWLGNQVPETRFLASSATELGAVAASSFGAGYGGSVWALVTEQQSEAFLKAWQQAYHAEFPVHRSSSRFFTESPGPGAFRVG